MRRYMPQENLSFDHDEDPGRADSRGDPNSNNSIPWRNPQNYRQFQDQYDSADQDEISERPQRPPAPRNYVDSRAPRNFDDTQESRNYNQPRGPRNDAESRDTRSYGEPRDPRSYQEPRDPRSYEEPRDPRSYDGPDPRNYSERRDPSKYREPRNYDTSDPRNYDTSDPRNYDTGDRRSYREPKRNLEDRGFNNRQRNHYDRKPGPDFNRPQENRYAQNPNRDIHRPGSGNFPDRDDDYQPRQPRSFQTDDDYQYADPYHQGYDPNERRDYDHSYDNRQPYQEHRQQEPERLRTPRTPLSHSPDYVDPKFGKRPVYDFGFGAGQKLGLRPSTPPPTYNESAPYFPGMPEKRHIDEPKSVYTISPPDLRQAPSSRDGPGRNDDNQSMYRRNNQSNDTVSQRQINMRDGVHPAITKAFYNDNRSIASSNGGHRTRSTGGGSDVTNHSHSFVPPSLPRSDKTPVGGSEGGGEVNKNKLEVIRGGKEREQWDNKVQYLLAVVGYAVGLGNIWRFPYLAQKNGGGAFLVPYLCMLVVEGVPLLILELHIGQRFRRGPLLAFRDMSKYAVGIGMACMVTSFLSACYYNTVISYCIFYMAMSIRSTLAWESCPGSPDQNDTKYEECMAGAGPASYFWYRETLDIADSIEDPGGISWKVFLSTMAAWILICVCLARGIKSSGKVVYFTATFPYLVLTIFLFRGITLDGAGEGLKHLFKPDFSKIFDGQVWREAASQIFFTLSLAGGGLISMSSYNSYNNNFAKDALIVATANSLTSLYAGAVIFSIVGHMATEKFKECNDAYDALGLTDEENTCNLKKFMTESVSGSGLVFITIAQACTEFGKAGPFFSFVFYFMLITLGMDSMFGILEAVTTSLMDLSLFKNVKQAVIVAVCCGCGFLLGITFTSTTGEYVFQMFDEYVASFPLFIIALSEVIVAGWLYGIHNFAQDFYLMTGHRPFAFLLVMLKFVCPIVMIIIFIVNIIYLLIDGAMYSRYDRDTGSTVKTDYPGWAKFICSMLTLICTAYIPIMATYVYITKRKLFPEEETEVFPEQELFKHYDLGAKDPYYPPVLFKQLRRDISVSDDIRSRHRMGNYSETKSDKSPIDRESVSIRSKVASDTSSVKNYELTNQQSSYNKPRADIEMQHSPPEIYTNQGYLRDPGFQEETVLDDNGHEFF